MGFDVGKWRAKLLFAPVYYRELEAYVRNKQALEIHVHGREIMSASYKDISTHKIDSLPLYIKTQILVGIGADINAAVDILKSQMVVLGATYIEAMLGEFFQELFSTHPGRMHDYLEKESGTQGFGWVRLADVIESDTKESLLLKLSQKAGQNALTGKIERILSRLETKTKLKMAAILKQKIADVIETRNRIVHEAVEVGLGGVGVREVFDRIEQLLLYLKQSAIANNVIISDPLDD